jgi:hypothetical protein
VRAVAHCAAYCGHEIVVGDRLQIAWLLSSDTRAALRQSMLLRIRAYLGTHAVEEPLHLVPPAIARSRGGWIAPARRPVSGDALRRGGPCGVDERPRPGRPRSFSPRRDSPKSRRWRASCRPRPAGRCRGGRRLNSRARARGIVCSISGTTVWRWLAEDAIRPWAWRSWLFPRDPDFRAKAGRVLDLYARRWEANGCIRATTAIGSTGDSPRSRRSTILTTPSTTTRTSRPADAGAGPTGPKGL